MGVKMNDTYLAPFIRQDEYTAIYPLVQAAHRLLESGSGAGSEYTGWLTLPKNYDKQEFARICTAAKKIQENSDVLVVVGIGGSYLGARAVLEAVKGAQYNLLCKGRPRILFAGASISPAALGDLLAICENVNFSVNVISKSGTTTEPAVAFRAFKTLLEKKYGPAGAKQRIYATTDAQKGTLRQLAQSQGYESFVVPDDIGGRYSVLTAVGLLPLAVAGVDISALMQGAVLAMQQLARCSINNPCYRWAAARHILYNKGKQVEVLACYEPDFAMMNEWYKQLFGESEGKDQKGIFPASVILTTDLHSMGQYLQDGRRFLFETVLDVKKPRSEYRVDALPDDFDGLAYLEKRPLSEINRSAMQATILAHADGGVPVAVLELDSLGEKDLGYLLYFFMKACAMCGYLLGINPFNQPGVESYKTNMFALLGKAGYGKLAAQLKKRL